MAWAACALAALLSPAARAEYHVEVGDVVEVSITGFPEMRQRAQVNMDGEITVPLLGAVKVAGLSLSQVRQIARDGMPEKSLRYRTSDGRENVIVLRPDDVTVTVAEYRPVYVNGDVSRPGEQPFRPGLTVRQVIAMAGGYEVAHVGLATPAMTIADLQGEQSAVLMETARERVRFLRLNALLAGSPALPPDQGPKLPLPPQLLADIARLEAEQLRVDTATHAAEQQALQRAAELAQDQIATLSQQQQQQQQNVMAQTSDLSKLRGFSDKGFAPLSRVADMQNTLAFASDRLLQTSAQMNQARQSLGDLRRQQMKADGQRRSDLLGQSEEAGLRLAALQTRLAAVEDKLRYAGAVRSQLIHGTEGRPVIQLFRKGTGEDGYVNAREVAEVQPGDVIEVAWRSNPAATAATP